MSTEKLASPPPPVLDLARRVAGAGGRLLIVGGWVRDRCLGRRAKDLDLEIYGLEADSITRLLSTQGFTPPVGRQFPVWRRISDGVDVALPRGMDEATSKAMPFDEQFRVAAQGRDLTINAMGWDPLEERMIDPLGGQRDLAERRLRAAHLAQFTSDPLRVVRIARISGGLDASIEPDLARVAGQVDLSGLPVERLAGELDRILLDLSAPWRAIECLRDLGQLGVYAPIADLEGVPQDPKWHPEGDVFLHTGLVVDCAAKIAAEIEATSESGAEAARAGGSEEGDARPAEREDSPSVLLWSALCHDLGKVATTIQAEDGRIRSPGHDVEGARLTREWLASLRIGAKRTEAVALLVRHHLAPALFVEQETGPRGYRRLARKLDAAGLTLADLERVARADHLGRTTPEALAGDFRNGRVFLERARAHSVISGIRRDVVSAATLMREGIPAGPELGRLLARSREIQDETGETDEAALVRRVLGEYSTNE